MSANINEISITHYSLSQKMNILDTAAKDFCIGCGLCVSCCPSKHLSLSHNSLNILELSHTEKLCLEKCNLCMAICPFSNDAPNEDILSTKLFSNTNNIKHHKMVGYYLNSYVGFSPKNEQRLNSASGGITSYLLEHLLNTKEIDAAIIVKKNVGNPLYSFTTCRDPQEIDKNARSAYYTISINEALDQILNDKTISQVAITTTPCMAKALRNACLKKPKLQRKIKFIIGIVCGQAKTHNFASYLASKNGIAKLIGIDFRTKTPSRPNGNFGTKLYSQKDEKEITFSSYAKEWSFSLFTPHACNFCDDVFAELADVVVMDAWLPEFKHSAKGENLIITRAEEIDKIINTIETVKKIKLDTVISSQLSVIEKKRSHISSHLKYAKKNFKYVPQKRSHLLHKCSFFSKYIVSLKYYFSRNSDIWWHAGSQNYDQFTKRTNKLKPLIFIGLVLNKVNTLIKHFR